MKFLALLFVYLMTSSGSCESISPFEYENNSRIVLKGILLNENGEVLQNQSIQLLSPDGSGTIIVKEVFSDNLGKMFLSSPKGNNPVYIVFPNKDIVNVMNNISLVNQPSYGERHWIGYLIDSYYDFGFIKLKNP